MTALEDAVLFLLGSSMAMHGESPSDDPPKLIQVMIKKVQEEAAIRRAVGG